MTSGTQGCGAGQVCYDVQRYVPDVGIEGRTLTILVGDEAYVIGQPRPGTFTPTATARATATPTPPLTGTPTCAPTGTPYCLSACQPCPESRPGCLAQPCGRCFENPHCGPDEECVPPGLISGGGCCACATRMPTATPCAEYPEPAFAFELTIDPPHPQVGDAVMLTFGVRNTTDGLAGLPSYSLIVDPPALDGVSGPETTGVTSLGVETVTFHGRAARTGNLSVQLGVSYETQRGCVGEFPVFFFSSSVSDPYGLTVDATPCPGDCNGDGRVTIDELLRVLNIGFRPQQIDDCRSGDVDGDGQINVAELVLAVGSALDGCPQGGVAR